MTKIISHLSNGGNERSFIRGGATSHRSKYSIFRRGMSMIKNCILGIILALGQSAYATGTCSDIYVRQSFPPLSINDGIVCFVQQRLLDDQTGIPIGLDGIVLYYIADGKAPVEAEGRGLLYDDVPGEIIDAF